MKLILLCSFLLLTWHLGVSQDTDGNNFKFDRLNAVEFNLGGHGIYYSFGVERIIVNKFRYKLSAKINVAYYPYSLNIAQSLWIPCTANNMISFGKHHAEFGAGLLVSRDHLFRNNNSNDLNKTWEKYGIFSLGYRHQSNNRRLFYKVLFTPVIELSNECKEMYPLAAATIGYSF